MARRSLSEYRQASTDTPSTGGRKSLSEYRDSLTPEKTRQRKEATTKFFKETYDKPIKTLISPASKEKAKQAVSKQKAADAAYRRSVGKGLEDVIAKPPAPRVKSGLERTGEVLQNFPRAVQDFLSMGLTTKAEQAMPERLRGPIAREYPDPLKGPGGLAGEIAGSLFPGAAAERFVGLSLKQAPRAVQTIARGIAGGVGSQAAVEARHAGDKTFEQSLRDIGTAGAFGGGLGAAGTGIASTVRWGKEKVLGDFAKVLLDRIRAPQVVREVAEGVPGIRPAAPRTEAFTPPLENPKELAKWVKLQAGFDDVSLNEMRRLDYEDLRQLADEIVQARSPRVGVPPSRQSLQQFREGAQPSLAVSQAPVRKSIQEFREIPPIQRDEIPFDLDDDEWGALKRVIGDDYEADEVVNTGLRQRLTTKADDMIANAKKDWAASGQFHGANLGPQLSILSDMAAGYMLKGTVKLVDVTEALVREFGESVRPLARQAWEAAKPRYKDMKIRTEADNMGMSGFSPTELKDRGRLLLNSTDLYRNFERVFGKHSPAVKKNILDPFDVAKGHAVQMQTDLLDELSTVTKELGIKKGSKDSALVQQFGEKRITLEQLKGASPNWENIVKADRFFRSKYDSLIDQVNDTVRQIYPNNPDKIVPKRSDYYRHFREQGDIAALKGLFQNTAGTSATIDPRLAGLSPFTQPKSRWASFKQKRGLGEFKDDAVGGFVDYIPAAAIAKFIDPQISVFRNLARNLAEQTKDTGNINNFITYLNNFANVLAGKTNPIDRSFEEFINRVGLRRIQWFNNRVKKNAILGNVGSVLAQTANIPIGVSFAKQYTPEAAVRTLVDLVKPSPQIAQSRFLKERYLGKKFREFNTGMLEKPDNFAAWTMEAADRVGTTFVWNGAYRQGIARKVADPIKYADENTRRLVAGRGVGEMPLLHSSQFGQLMLPFQVEVANLWHVMSDQVRAKDFGGILLLFVGNYMLNRVMESTRGSPVAFDPIDAIIDAATAEDLNPLQRVGRLGGEALSSFPGGSILASMYPEYGATIPGLGKMSRTELFGKKDPTRFGTAPIAVKSLENLAFRALPPFGGAQLKKTIEGAQSLRKGAAFTPKGEAKFPVEKDIGNISRALLFGPTATAEGKRYYKEEQRPLSAEQTKKFKASPNPQVYFENLQKKRKEATERLKRKRELKAK